MSALLSAVAIFGGGFLVGYLYRVNKDRRFQRLINKLFT